MNIYQVDFHLLSPLQVGCGSLGMIERTLLFIPGRIVWGALTNSIVCCSSLAPSADLFRSVGDALRQGRFSSFFPLLFLGSRDRKQALRRMVPSFKDACFFDENDISFRISGDEMDSLLRCSVESTSIDPGLLSAGESTLHSTELVRAEYRDAVRDKLHPVSFRGFIELPDSVSVDGCQIALNADSVKEFFSKLRLGGGRKRGWGMILPDSVSIVPDYSHFESIRMKDGVLLTSEAPVSPGDRVNGRAVLACYREYDPEYGFGQRFSKPALVWPVGSFLYA